MMKQNQMKIYGISLLLPIVVGFLGSIATSAGMDAYDLLAKPGWTPPPQVFPIVWTILYLLMGFGAARIYNSSGPNRDTALTLYGIQLAFNGLWSILFFGLGWYFLSFVWIVILWILVLSMIQEFYLLDKTAALLQIPYLIWLTIAGALNFAIWFMNR